MSKEKMISFRVDLLLFKRIDYRAQKLKMSKSAYILKLIETHNKKIKPVFSKEVGSIIEKNLQLIEIYKRDEYLVERIREMYKAWLSDHNS